MSEPTAPMALIADYAKEYATLTDAAADRLTTKALDLEARRQATKAKYYEKVKTALSPRTAMRDSKVVGARPSRSAAPPAPRMRHAVASSTRRM